MHRNFREIHEKILEFVIEFLQENDKYTLYNEIICNKLSITRHTLYNHFNNINDIYNQIILRANNLINNSITEYSIIREHITQGIEFLILNKKIMYAAFKLKDDFFIEFYKNYKYAKKQRLSKNENYEIHWLKMIQIYGTKQFIDFIFQNIEKYDKSEIINFICKLISKIDDSNLLDE